jgi:hypothetical protein
MAWRRSESPLAGCCPPRSGESGSRIAEARSAVRPKKNIPEPDGTDEETRSTTRQGSQGSHWELEGGVRRGLGRYVLERGLLGRIGHNGVTRLRHAEISRNTLNDPGDLPSSASCPTQCHKGDQRRKVTMSMRKLLSQKRAGNRAPPPRSRSTCPAPSSSLTGGGGRPFGASKGQAGVVLGI